MSQVMTLNEMYEDSDDGSSVYSMQGYDANYLGPPPKYEEFPPFKEKPPVPRPVPFPLQLNKKQYFAFHEAIPHGELYCEYPHCSEIFLPYVVWGLRHHCRACGITVCENHCTRNITLSSNIIPYYNGDLAELTTPILATSKNFNTLPDIVTLKYACLLCADKALCSAAVHRRSKSSWKATEEPSNALVGPRCQPPDHVSAEINRLQSLLCEVRGELQTRDRDVSELAGQMGAYSQQTVDLQKIIQNLDMQLQVVRTEGRLSNTGRRKLKKLKEELKGLQRREPKGNTTSSLPESGWGGEEDDTSSAADSLDSSESRPMSLDGVNSIENTHTPVHSKILDPFYHNVVIKACGSLSATGEASDTPEPAVPARPGSSATGKPGSGRKVQLPAEEDKLCDRNLLATSPMQYPARTLSARVEYSDIYEGVHGRDSLEDMLDFDPVVDTLAQQLAPDATSSNTGALIDLPAAEDGVADPSASPVPMQGLGEVYALSTASSVFCMLEEDEGEEGVLGPSSSYPSMTASTTDDFTYSTLTSTTATDTPSKKSLTETAETTETAALQDAPLPAVFMAQSPNTINPLRIKRKSHNSSLDSTT